MGSFALFPRRAYNPSMRRVLAIGCCALWLGFGSLAGLAHVHHSYDHHDDSRGFHLDHSHLAHAEDHDHGDLHLTPDHHVNHHGENVAYLSDGAIRAAHGARLLPALVPAAPTVESTASSAEALTGRPCKPREPPERFLPDLRAPPA